MAEYKNRIVKLFSDKSDSSKKLICYFPVGDPIADSVKLADVYFNAGVDVLEIGLAVEDPYLDGATVSDSMKRTRQAHTLDECLQMVKQIRSNHPDSVLEIFCYKQIFDRLPKEQFNDFLKQADIDCVLIPDHTMEENRHMRDWIVPSVSVLNFLPYNCDEENLEFLSEYGDGFVFLQAVEGGTGARKELDPKLKEHIDLAKSRIKCAAVCPGFGISTPEHCRQVKEFGADGLIIGSEVLKKMQESIEVLAEFLKECKNSLK